MELEQYTQYQETRLHEQPGFAYNTYLCTIPQDFDRVNLHWHEQMELIYIKKGSGSVSVNLACYPVSAGCIVPVLPGELHAIEGDPGVRMEYENIIFSLALLDSLEADDWCRGVVDALRQGALQFERPICPGSDFHRAVSAALDGADEACARRTPGYALLVKSQLFKLLYALHSFQQTAGEARPNEDAEKLKGLVNYVKDRFREPISVADAAAVAGYSPSHFMRIFRQVTGRTFVEYLTDYRLSAAVYYLKETDDDIGTVAANCGFDNISYFIRRFHRKYGTSPGRYRRNPKNM
ncbi:MAG: helix-turn-helix transcriptional regulator [Clostridia bacterium]|nr:helix-turn-helix transcriptional regulator [Clostridia bacterium]